MRLIQDIIISDRPRFRSQKRPKSRSFRHFFTLILICIFSFGAYYAYSAFAESRELEAAILAAAPATVELPAGLNRTMIGKAIGDKYGWDNEKISNFEGIFVQVQWAEFNKELTAVMSDKFKWDKYEQEIFAINSTEYFKPEQDFLGELYVPGTYTFERKASDAEIANALVAKVKAEAGNNLEAFIAQKIPAAATEKIADFVDEEMNLKPDLVLIPARDIQIERATSTLLRFTTMYYNQGNGPLELRADPATADHVGDINRDVFQRIYRADGSYNDKNVGNFLWHQAHLHYHYADFVTYDLKPVNVSNAPNLTGVLTKSTFCVRDVSKVEIDLENRPSDAKYKKCGKNLQGISVGWADTYFYSYPGQALDISDLPSGTYKLSFIVNPSNILEETDLENNTSSVLINIDMSTEKVTILEETPKNAPNFKHVYEEQVFD